MTDLRTCADRTCGDTRCPHIRPDGWRCIHTEDHPDDCEGVLEHLARVYPRWAQIAVSDPSLTLRP